MKALLLLLPLAACAHSVTERPDPIVQTVEVKVPVAVPCKALAELGPEPTYPDTDAALKAAPDLFERVKLLAAGRVLRAARLARYTAAAASC